MGQLIDDWIRKTADDPRLLAGGGRRGDRRQLLVHEGVRLGEDRAYLSKIRRLDLVAHDRRCAVGLPGRLCRCRCVGKLHGSGVFMMERAARGSV